MVDVSAGPDRLPAEGEVAVGVDTVGVLACAGREAVGIEIVDDPQVETGRWYQMAGARTTEIPAHSFPWMQPKTTIRRRGFGPLQCVTVIGRPRTDRPTVTVVAAARCWCVATARFALRTDVDGRIAVVLGVFGNASVSVSAPAHAPHMSDAATRTNTTHRIRCVGRRTGTGSPIAHRRATRVTAHARCSLS